MYFACAILSSDFEQSHYFLRCLICYNLTGIIKDWDKPWLLLPMNNMFHILSFWFSFLSCVEFFPSLHLILHGQVNVPLHLCSQRMQINWKKVQEGSTSLVQSITTASACMASVSTPQTCWNRPAGNPSPTHVEILTCSHTSSRSAVENDGNRGPLC